MEYGVLGVCDLSAVWDGLLQEKKIQRDQTCCSLCCLQEMDGFCTVASSEKSSCVTVIYRKCSAGSSICFWPLAVTVSPRVTALLREMGSFIGNIRFKFSHSNTEFKIKPCQFPLFPVFALVCCTLQDKYFIILLCMVVSLRSISMIYFGQSFVWLCSLKSFSASVTLQMVVLCVSQCYSEGRILVS